MRSGFTSGRRWKIIFSVLLAFAALSWFAGARGGLGSFSPERLECRSQAEYRVLDVPVYWSFHTYHRPRIVKFLIAKGYWASTPDRPTWISTFHWNRTWTDGDSLFNKRFFWRTSSLIKWTDQHPEWAAVLWPEVLRLLRSGRDGLAAMLIEKCTSGHIENPTEAMKWMEENCESYRISNSAVSAPAPPTGRGPANVSGE